MPRYFVLLFLLIIPTLMYSQELSFLSYNIRYDNPNDGDNRWDNRKEFLANQVKFFEPMVMGIQEGLKHQLEYLDQQLVNYTYFGVGRDDGKEKGEYTAIFYKRDQLQLLNQSTFWLSKTPNEISVGWDAALERICTYGFFQDKASGKKFYVFNTHFDHIGKKARKNSAKLILKKIQEVNTEGLPVILMGDFNLSPDSQPIKLLSKNMNDSRMHATQVAFGPEGTFNGFKHDSPLLRRIDYIFTSLQAGEIRKYAVLSDSKDLRYPSDHLPVYIELKFNP